MKFVKLLPHTGTLSPIQSLELLPLNWAIAGEYLEFTAASIPAVLQFIPRLTPSSAYFQACSTLAVAKAGLNLLLEKARLPRVSFRKLLLPTLKFLWEEDLAAVEIA
jgi:hypothetical protein